VSFYDGSEEAMDALCAVVLDRISVRAQTSVAMDFIRVSDLGTSRPYKDNRLADEVAVYLTGEILAVALSPRVTRENKEVARVPDGKWQALRAAFGWKHRTRPVMAEVSTTIRQLLPVGLSKTGLVALDSRSRDDKIAVAYCNLGPRKPWETA
jgi:hypothetical protein